MHFLWIVLNPRFRPAVAIATKIFGVQISRQESSKTNKCYVPLFAANQQVQCFHLEHNREFQFLLA